MLGYMVRSVELHAGVMVYMVGSVELHGGDCWLHGGEYWIT